METNLNPWNDRLEIEGDAREEIVEGFDNLKTTEEIAEFEAWLSGFEIVEVEEFTDCSLHGMQDGPDCPRC